MAYSNYFIQASFFVHIKSLWGLLYQDLVPSSTPMNLLTDFYAYFNNVSQLESVSKAQSPDLVPCQDITIGADSQPGKVAKSIGHLSDSYFQFAKNSLACFGICVWSPNLDENPDHLYREACRISSISSFQQCAAAGACNYMNINKAKLNNYECFI